MVDVVTAIPRTRLFQRKEPPHDDGEENLWTYCHVYVCDYRRGLDWWMDLLTTYTHDSELQAITTLSLLYTLYKSIHHTLSIGLFIVFPIRCLVTAPNNGDSWACTCSCPLASTTTKLSAPNVLVIASRHGPHKKCRSSTVAFVSVVAGTCLSAFSQKRPRRRPLITAGLLLLCARMLLALPSNIFCLQSHRLATGLYATLSFPPFNPLCL
jgi:hypothetical protein